MRWLLRYAAAAMIILIVGLVVFLGVHSIRIFADGWRTQAMARVGTGPWKGLFALAALAGFALIVWGFGIARAQAPLLWSPPSWTHHVTALLVLIAFILVAAAYVPGTHIKAAAGHPMLAGVKTWSFAHLLANGTLADVVLFGSFLVWSVLAYRASRRRDRAAGKKYPAAGWSRDAIAIVAGALAWGWFAHLGHAWLIGVRPFG